MDIFKSKNFIHNNQRFLVAFFPKGRKAISPVVATALLLVVAVVSVIGFQGWFQTFSSNMFVEIEQSSSIKNLNIGVEALIGDTLYFKAGENTTIISVTIDGIECNDLNNTYSGMEILNVSVCMENVISKTPEIVIVTNKGVFSKTVFISDNSNSFDEVLITLDITQCRFKDNKEGCENYYILENVDGIDVVHDTISGIYWEQNLSNLTMNLSEAKNYCLGKGTGWRLPTLVELETSLVDTKRESAPYIVSGIESDLFTNIQSNWYWTNTKFSNTIIYIVYFSDGRSNNGAYDYQNYYVLCMKEDENYSQIWGNIQKFEFEGGIGQERVIEEFTLNASICGGVETMYDNITNLCWEQSPHTSILTLANAVNRCDGLAVAGGGWRLPEKAELMTLLFHNGIGTASVRLNSIGFTGIQNSYYWTNTEYSLTPDTHAYNVNFNYGFTFNYDITYGLYVLCVKNPQ